MNKSILTLLSVLLMIGETRASWFGHDREYQQRIQQTEQQLDQQRHATGDWQIVAGIFAIGSVALFVVGTAVGSTIRRYGRKE